MCLRAYFRLQKVNAKLPNNDFLMHSTPNREVAQVRPQNLG